jgi:pentafunctional AROM polypeptide
VGYNTDWIGIQRPILAKLRAGGEPWAGCAAGLVVGAGGTARAACHAVRSLGLKLYVTNRSPEKGRELAKLFGGTFVTQEELESLGGSMPVKVVVSTVPFAAAFKLPPSLVQQRPVVLDVVYKPARTELMQQALAAGCPVIQGATMLLTQGLEQFELWNRRRAPIVEMDAAIFAGAERLDV